jgi:hypothetical protein
MRLYAHLTVMATACVAVFMLFMALHPAHAQRCPAGADAFGSCLPLDHRYGGPGQIQRWRPTPETGRGHEQTQFPEMHVASRPGNMPSAVEQVTP